MIFRKILDTITDVLTLLALAVAGAGLFMPWFTVLPQSQPAAALIIETSAGEDLAVDPKTLMMDFQMWHVVRSGAALAVTALLVFVSLTVGLGTNARKALVLAMFVSMAAALVFQAMVFTYLPVSLLHREVAEIDWREREGLLVTMIPSVIAGALCLLRMGWTMTASASPAERRGRSLEEEGIDARAL